MAGADDGAVTARFALCEAAIEPAALRALLPDPAAGAFVTFEGWVRDHHEGRAVTGLDYEAYAELADREGGAIMAEAIGRFGIIAALCRHRVGHLAVGELAVWVGVCSGHRDEAFTACRYIIDQVKERVPIWKREHYIEQPSAWLHPSGPSGAG